VTFSGDSGTLGALADVGEADQVVAEPPGEPALGSGSDGSRSWGSGIC
jgi:hypothetical protein